MLFEMKSSTLHFNEGETHTGEELSAAGCDLDWLMKKGAIVPVGFITDGPARTDSEQAEVVARLQAKIEALDNECDDLKAELSKAKGRVRILEEGHKVGSAQLREALAECEQLRAQLKRG